MTNCSTLFHYVLLRSGQFRFNRPLPWPWPCYKFVYDEQLYDHDDNFFLINEKKILIRIVSGNEELFKNFKTRFCSSKRFFYLIININLLLFGVLNDRVEVQLKLFDVIFVSFLTNFLYCNFDNKKHSTWAISQTRPCDFTQSNVK